MTDSTEDLLADFALLDDWEERYRYIIELGRELPAMEPALKTAATKVSGCASQVWIFPQIVTGANGGSLHLQGDSDALIVKGLMALVFRLFAGRTLQQAAQYDPMPVFQQIGLQDHLTPQRSNGLASMVKRIRSDAQAALDSISA